MLLLTVIIIKASMITTGIYFQNELIKDYATENISLNMGTISLALKLYKLSIEQMPIGINLVVSSILIFSSLTYNWLVIIN